MPYARFFIILGVIFIAIGGIIFLFPHLHLFRLPGDIVIRKDNVTFYVPLVTGIVLSLILTILINLIIRR
jgi:hypothetical protein